jgi:hypothetical protein
MALLVSAKNTIKYKLAGDLTDRSSGDKPTLTELVKMQV